MARIIEWLDADLQRIAVNLDHVVCIREQGDQLLFYGTDRRLIESCENDNFPDGLDDLAAPVVPASHDAIGLHITDFSTGDEPITVEGLYIERIPIVAWQITNNGAEGFGPKPVFIQPPASNTIALICLPDGRLLDRAQGVYESLDEALKAIVVNLRAEQDRSVARAAERKAASAE